MAARHDHHLGGLLVREVEDLVEHLLLGRLDHAGVLGRRHDVADVLLGVRDHTSRGRRDPEEAGDGVPRRLQHPHDRVHDPRQPVERPCHRHGQALRALERDRLGRELTEDDAQVGQDQEGDDERDAARQAVEVARDQRLAHGTEKDPEDADPDLDDRDEADGIVHEPQGDLRVAASSLGTLLQACPARRHERVLGRHEHRVPQHEGEDREDSEEVVHAPLSGARVLGGSSSTSVSGYEDSGCLGALHRARRRGRTPTRRAWRSIWRAAVACAVTAAPLRRSA